MRSDLQIVSEVTPAVRELHTLEVLGLCELDVNAPPLAAGLVLAGRVREGVVVRSVLDGIGDRLHEIIAVIDRLTARIGGERLHRSVYGGIICVKACMALRELRTLRRIDAVCGE